MYIVENFRSNAPSHPDLLPRGTYWYLCPMCLPSYCLCLYNTCVLSFSIKLDFGLSDTFPLSLFPLHICNLTKYEHFPMFLIWILPKYHFKWLHNFLSYACFICLISCCWTFTITYNYKWPTLTLLCQESHGASSAQEAAKPLPLSGNSLLSQNKGDSFSP